MKQPLPGGAVLVLGLLLLLLPCHTVLLCVCPAGADGGQPYGPSHDAAGGAAERGCHQGLSAVAAGDQGRPALQQRGARERESAFLRASKRGCGFANALACGCSARWQVGTAAHTFVGY